MAKRWTDNDIDELRKMATRYPAPKIAETINRSVAGDVFKAHKLKISLRPADQTVSTTFDPGASGFELQE
jgi:hypothetical protein